MIFSHGQASVDSSFSINSSIMKENFHEESLVAQQLVYDLLNSLNGIDIYTGTLFTLVRILPLCHCYCFINDFTVNGI